MAIWRVVSSREGLKISYKNWVTKTVFECGLVRADTPERMVLEWVIGQDAARPRDWLQLPGGRFLQLLPPCEGRH